MSKYIYILESCGNKPKEAVSKDERNLKKQLIQAIDDHILGWPKITLIYIEWLSYKDETDFGPVGADWAYIHPEETVEYFADAKYKRPRGGEYLPAKSFWGKNLLKNEWYDSKMHL